MKLWMIALPVVFLGALQLSACSVGGGSTGGVYMSKSAGAHFDQSVKLEKLGENDPESIASFPLGKAYQSAHDSRSVLVAAGSRGIVVSDNRGESWRVVEVPLAAVHDVVQLENSIMVVSGVDEDGQGFIMRSADEGDSWQVALTVPLPGEKEGFAIIDSGAGESSVVISLALDPFDGNVVWAGTSLGNILRGEQSGKTWRTVYTLSESSLFGAASGPQFAVVELIPSPFEVGELLIITAEQKLWRVNSLGQEELTVPLHLDRQGPQFGGGVRRIFSVVYVSQFPDALFAGVNDGAVFSRDRGQTWHKLPLPLDVLEQFSSVEVAVSPTNPSRLLVAIGDVVYRSEDGGESWNTFTLQATGRTIVELLIDPTNAANVLAVTAPIKS